MRRYHNSRFRDVETVLTGVQDPRAHLLVLAAFGQGLRDDLARALREVIATGIWDEDPEAPLRSDGPGPSDAFRQFLNRDLKDRRDRGPTWTHLAAALLFDREARAVLHRSKLGCPQNCRTTAEPYSEGFDQLADYWQALYGWYGVIRHAGDGLARAAAHFIQDESRAEHATFTAYLTPSEPWPVRRNGRTDASAADASLRVLILMMQAWDPGTVHTLQQVLKYAEDPEWHYEPGRMGLFGAQNAPGILVEALNAGERARLRGIVEELHRALESDSRPEGGTEDPGPCSSDVHRPPRGREVKGERARCTAARTAVFRAGNSPEAPLWFHMASGSARITWPRAGQWLLGSPGRRLGALAARLVAGLPQPLTAAAASCWPDRAAELGQLRRELGLTTDAMAQALGMQEKDISAIETGTAPRPATVAQAAGYLLVLALAAAEESKETEVLPTDLTDHVRAVRETEGAVAL
ncbi:helix-turn-helix domain-containing protein [Streptomyces bambusae]|uniref:helix-turn-helix domain-containing protein n=1 Tax=Streptomyces bambusae TaxID=1550616 RepID=UPI001CFDC666|nr:helix-turn-helix domain-containing protein [Streptomyces bambusae]MCB5168878.1 helix-turn-helix domain-containing protein [Streptomyces bambusae]